METMDRARWDAVVGRRNDHDGLFVYAVRTTGVFCRPSCSARQPKRENVSFFATVDAAIDAGYRPCLRCRPAEARPADDVAVAVAAACRQLESTDAAVEEVARALGWSSRHLQRRFRELVGVPMAAYRRQAQADRARQHLRNGAAVTEAVYRAGYGSSRAFYDHGAPRLGMAPAQYAAGGEGAMIRSTVFETALGWVIAAVTSKGLCAVRMGDDPEALARDLGAEFPEASLVDASDDEVSTFVDALRALAEGRSAQPLPLDVRGTAFQAEVWEAIKGIPHGETVTYAQLAEAIGRPSSVRAVANAVGANRVALAIPCHRVVRTDGTGGGYRWGVDRKRLLLAAERRPAAEA